MQILRLSGLIGISLLMLLSFQNCSQRNFTAGSPQALEQNKALVSDLPSIDQQIQTLVADKSCLEDADCASIGYGAKACGGPRSYLIYSLQRTNVDELTELVEGYNTLQSEDQRDSAVFGTCEYLMPPELACLEYRCQALVND